MSTGKKNDVEVRTIAVMAILVFFLTYHNKFFVARNKFVLNSVSLPVGLFRAVSVYANAVGIVCIHYANISISGFFYSSVHRRRNVIDRRARFDSK